MEKLHTINRLSALRQKDKFSAPEWEKRGLSPSGAECCLQLDMQFNDTLDALITAVENNASSRQLKSLLSQHLSAFDKSEYDTEEREFIADTFHKLSTIVDVDIKYALNSWMYGIVLGTLIKISTLFKRPRKVIETLSQECSNCKTALDTFILERGNEIPDLCWDIIQCDSCNEFNLLNKGPHIRQLRFGNYRWVEQLSKDEFNEEQAIVRLEQIKYFRKK
ncbi:DUF4844 domain-containing protein [Chitinophaga oryziterrae]|uniref:DUF4844 domain-containing protein n=1 Tax=Chitinophaga oryziterrae TaxID=1031224 RepID=A0A6N8J1J1_9BACT|nr:DUF4844 domain-containing protein [Chitinophaga oryziterrae]MVT39040.1 DUF4844 domain-containing protein [Chitinophaga oryziterrae]